MGEIRLVSRRPSILTYLNSLPLGEYFGDVHQQALISPARVLTRCRVDHNAITGRNEQRHL